MKNNNSIDKALSALAASIQEFGKAQKYLDKALGSKTAPIHKKESATTKVFKIINQSDWIDYQSLLKMTGFNEKKLQGIIFNLKRKDRIEYIGRGVYKRKE